MLKKLIIFLLMALVTSVNAESNETVEEESKISTIGGILQIKKDEVGLKSFFLDQQELLDDTYSLASFSHKETLNNADYLLLYGWGGGNKNPGEYYLLRVAKDKSWRIFSLPMPFLGRTDSPDGNSEEVRLFKDGEFIKVFVPAKDNDSYRWIDIVLTFDKYGNQLSEVRKLNPHSLYEDNLSRSDLEGKPPIAILYYPPIKKIFTKNKQISQLYKKLEEYWGSPISVSEDRISAVGVGVGACNFEKIFLTFFNDGRYFLIFPNYEYGHAIGIDIYTNFNIPTATALAKIIIHNQNEDVGWIYFDTEKFKTSDSKCSINGKSKPCSQFLINASAEDVRPPKTEEPQPPKNRFRDKLVEKDFSQIKQKFKESILVP